MRSILFTIFGAAIVGVSFEANAQVDLNLQTRLESFSPSIAKSGETKLEVVCDVTPKDAAKVIHSGAVPSLTRFKKENEVLTEAYLRNNPEIFESVKPFAAPVLPIDTCKTKQPTTVRLSLAFNPTYETNALKARANPEEDHAFAVGPTLLVTTGGFRDFDVMGVSEGTASARYNKFDKKSFDSISTQAIYQFFVGAFSYGKDGRPFSIDERTDKLRIPPPNLITVDTLAIALQNQMSYTPTFKTRNADLFTPQVQYTRSNISLLGADPRNVCLPSESSYKKHAFCYFADVYLNVGQTFSDVRTQENTNVAGSVTLGRRIDHTDWKIALQATLTGREYQNVPGGRRDLLLQTGPSISYSHPAITTPVGKVSVSFNVPITYSNNHSSLATAEWHGWVVMPTLTLAYVPQ